MGMSNQLVMGSGKSVVVSAFLAAVVVSLLWLVIPPSDVWTISYIFTLIAIIGITTSFLAYTKKVTQVPQGHSFPITAVNYAKVSIPFSAIAVFLTFIELYFPTVVYAIIHAAILIYFVIRVIALFSGSGYIDKVGERAEQKHEELNQDKEDYWK